MGEVKQDIGQIEVPDCSSLGGSRRRLHSVGTCAGCPNERAIGEGPASRSSEKAEVASPTGDNTDVMQIKIEKKTVKWNARRRQRFHEE